MSTVFGQIAQNRRAWLAADVLPLLEEEATLFSPQETGGVLLGYWDPCSDEPVITRAVGSGPGAVHGPTYYIPDHEHDSLHIALAYEQSGRTLHYLGDWHSHPGQPGYLSRKDRRTLLTIARFPEAYAPRPLMLILAYGRPWQPCAWSLRLIPTWRRCSRATIESREVVVV